MRGNAHAAQIANDVWRNATDFQIASRVSPAGRAHERDKGPAGVQNGHPQTVYHPVGELPEFWRWKGSWFKVSKQSGYSRRDSGGVITIW